jgi:hypothetical protein
MLGFMGLESALDCWASEMPCLSVYATAHKAPTPKQLRRKLCQNRTRELTVHLQSQCL